MICWITSLSLGLAVCAFASSLAIAFCNHVTNVAGEDAFFAIFTIIGKNILLVSTGCHSAFSAGGVRSTPSDLNIDPIVSFTELDTAASYNSFHCAINRDLISDFSASALAASRRFFISCNEVSCSLCCVLLVVNSDACSVAKDLIFASSASIRSP